MATAAAMPDMKVSDPGSLASMAGSPINATSRQTVVDRANRSTERTTASFGAANGGVAATADVWLLPMTGYTVAPAFGERAGTLHQGVDLQVAEGTPFYASHGGTVSLARWYGGYGYCVIVDVGNGVQLVYGHASKMLVHEGQRVASGDLLALAGNTGYSFSPHVHFEVRVNGQTTNPIAFLLDHGVDLTHHKDSLTS